MSRWLFGNSNVQHPGNVSSFKLQVRTQFEPLLARRRLPLNADWHLRNFRKQVKMTGSLVHVQNQKCRNATIQQFRGCIPACLAISHNQSRCSSLSGAYFCRGGPQNRQNRISRVADRPSGIGINCVRKSGQSSAMDSNSGTGRANGSDPAGRLCRV